MFMNNTNGVLSGRYLKRYLLFLGFTLLLIGFMATNISQAYTTIRSLGFSADTLTIILGRDALTADYALLKSFGLIGFLLLIPNCIYAWFLGIRWNALIVGIQSLIAMLGVALLVLFLALFVPLILPLILGDRDAALVISFFTSLVMGDETGTLNILASAYAFLNNVFNATSDYLLVGCCLTGYISTLYMILMLSPRSYDSWSFKSLDGGWYGFSWLLNMKVGVLNENGALVVRPDYDEINACSEDYCAVRIDNKWGYIRLGKNLLNELALSPKFEIWPKYRDAGRFREGLAYVKLDGKYGFIDKTGKEVIPRKYDDVGFFSEGLAYVELDDKEGFVDKKGNEYWGMGADEARQKMKER